MHSPSWERVCYVTNARGSATLRGWWSSPEHLTLAMILWYRAQAKVWTPQWAAQYGQSGPNGKPGT